MKTQSPARQSKVPRKQIPPYQNPALPPARRVKDLLSRMTLEEKAAQMMCVWQQKAETGPKKPSTSEVGDVANLLYRLNNALDNSPASADFMTPSWSRRPKRSCSTSCASVTFAVGSFASV